MTIPGTIDVIMIIVAIVLVLIVFILSLVQTIKGKRPIGVLPIILLILGLLFVVFLTYRARELEAANWAEILLLIGLVTITAVYANASVKMAEEMERQTIMSSRPYIIQKPIHRTDEEGEIWEEFSHFEVYNAGNSPAIRFEILLLDKENRLLEKQTDPLFLRAAESTAFRPSSLVTHVGSTCYLLCQYQSVFSGGKGQQICYQTWLPLEPIKLQRGGIIVKSGELKFCEVFEKKSY